MAEEQTKLPKSPTSIGAAGKAAAGLVKEMLGDGMDALTDVMEKTAKIAALGPHVSLMSMGAVLLFFVIFFQIEREFKNREGSHLQIILCRSQGAYSPRNSLSRGTSKLWART
jgi:hypothetical protein